MTSVSDTTELARQAVAALLRVPVERDSAPRARELIANGHGAALFHALIDALQHSDDKEQQVRAAMSALEKLIDTSPYVAGYLMARLYPIASQQKQHAAYNAIELWMHNIDSAEIAEALKLLTNERVRPRLQATYKEWADAIAKKSAAR